MADFTNSVQSGVQSPITPQQGVGDNSVASAISSTGNVLSGIGEGLFGSNARQIRKGIEKGHENNFLADYEQQQLKLANAVDQGAMSSDEARMRMRANFYKASAAFKGDPDDLAKAHANIVNTTGLGKVIATGTKQEQMEQMLYTEGAKRGFVKPDMSDDEKDFAVMQMQKMDMAAAQLSAAQSELTFQRGQIGLQSDKVQLATAKISQQTAGVNLQSSRLELAQKEAETRSRMALGQMQDGYNYQLASDLKDIQKKFDAHQIDPKQAILMIDEKMATVRGLVGSLGAYAGNDYINNMIAPMKMRAETMKSYINGDIDNKILDNKNHKIEATQKNLLLGDKRIAQLSAGSQLLQNMPFQVQKEAGDLMMELIRKNGTAVGPTENSKGTAPANLLSNDPTDKKGVKNYLNVLKGGIASYLEGDTDNPDAMKAEITANLTNSLRSIPAYGHLADAKDYNDLTDFIADPSFGRYTTENGGIPADVRHDAAKVLHDEYDNVVMPAIVKKYKETVEPLANAANFNPFSMADTKPVRDDTVKQSIHPEFNGTGVVFVSNDVGDVDATKKAKELNKDVAPILNKLVRMHAHLDGNMDYRKTYETYYAAQFDPNLGQNDNGD